MYILIKEYNLNYSAQNWISQELMSVLGHLMDTLYSTGQLVCEFIYVFKICDIINITSNTYFHPL